MLAKPHRALLIAMLLLAPSAFAGEKHKLVAPPEFELAQGIGLGLGLDDVRQIKVTSGGGGPSHALALISGGYIRLINGGKITCVATSSC